MPALALLVLGCALYLPRLGTTGLWDPWEPKYAQTAREMSEKGSWVVPYYREDPRLNKPPMTYWLIRGSHAVFGVNETAARLPSASLAVLCAIALGLAFSVRGRSLEGFLAGAALLTAPQWLLLGRFATPDIPLAAFLGIALASVLAMRAIDAPRGKRILRVLTALAIAAAALTDWPRGLLLPAWAVLGWGTLRLGVRGALALACVAAFHHAGQLTHGVALNVVAAVLGVAFALRLLVTKVPVSWRVVLVGLGVVVLLVGPWLLTAYLLEPDEMSLFEYKHAFNLGESTGQHTGPYHAVLRILAVGALPWIALAAVGLIRGIGRRRDEMATVLAGTCLGFTLFFTLSEARMGHFYGAMQPAVAGLAGIGAVALIRKPGWAGAAAMVTLVATWFVIRRDPSRILETATVKDNYFGLVDPTALVTGAVAVWALLVAVAVWRRKETWGPACVLPAAVIAAYLAFHVVPVLEPKKSLAPMWRAYVEARRGDEPIGLFGKAKDSAFYYSNNEVVRMKDPAVLREFLSGPGVKYLVTSPATVARLRSSGAPGNWDILVDSHPSHVLARYEPAAE